MIVAFVIVSESAPSGRKFKQAVIGNSNVIMSVASFLIIGVHDLGVCLRIDWTERTAQLDCEIRTYLSADNQSCRDNRFRLQERVFFSRLRGYEVKTERVGVEPIEQASSMDRTIRIDENG